MTDQGTKPIDVPLEKHKLSKEEKKELIIEYMKRFPFYKWAAKSVGMSEDGLRIWRDEDSEFSARLEIARAEGINFFGGKATPDLILKSADPKTFAKKDQLDITSGGQPITSILGNGIQQGNGNGQVAKTDKED